MGGDQGLDDVLDVAAGEVVGFEGLRGDRVLLGRVPAWTAMILVRTITLGFTLRIDIMIRFGREIPARDILRLDPEAEVAGQDHKEDEQGQDDDAHDPPRRGVPGRYRLPRSRSVPAGSS